MMTLEAQTTIARPRAEVFAAMTDIPGMSAHITGIDSVEMLSDGGFGPGTRWRETRTILGKSATEEMEVTAVEPGRSYRVEAESRGTHYLTEITFADSGNGSGTRVKMTFKGKPLSLGAKLLSPLGKLMAGSARKMLQKDLEDIRTHLESGPSAGAPAAT